MAYNFINSLFSVVSIVLSQIFNKDLLLLWRHWTKNVNGNLMTNIFCSEWGKMAGNQIE